MKILYVITGLGLGGAEKVTINLAEEMYRKGHQVKIAYLTGDAIVKPLISDIELVSLELNSISNILNSLSIYRKLLMQFKPDVIHSHMVHANIFSRLNRLLYISYPRLICSAHSNYEGGRLRMLAYRLTHCLSDVTTNVSKNAVKQFEELKAVPKGGMITVYNGIDLRKFSSNLSTRRNILQQLNIDESSKILLSVGRLTDPKDYPNLINAVSILKSRSLNFKLLIVGDGNLRKDIEQQIKKLNMVNNIILLGARNDIPELMNTADLFLLSSKYEGFGLVIAEAMACEKFVVATDCGGSSEILGNTGILVPIQNSQLLAKGIEKAFSLSQDEIMRNGKKARKRVETLFSLNSIVDKWLTIYAK